MDKIGSHTKKVPETNSEQRRYYCSWIYSAIGVFFAISLSYEQDVV